MHGDRLVGLALGTALLGFAASAVAGPQVTIYLPGYGQPAPQTQAAPAQPSGPPSAGGAGGYGAYQGEAALAQVAAYAQYLQYVQAMSYASARSTSSAASQYFTNGAAVTTVPSAGQPGSAYFTNGAEATLTAAAAPSTSPAPPPAPPSSPPSSRSSPWWWGDSAPSTAPATPPPAPAAAPPPAAPPPEPATAVAAMSFDEWLQSMGAESVAAAAPQEGPLSAESAETDIDEAPLSEPLATAFEVRPRTSFALPEKRDRLALGAGSRSTGGTIAWAFAAGLLLGALAMLRPRLRLRSGGAGASSPAK